MLYYLILLIFLIMAKLLDRVRPFFLIIQKNGFFIFLLKLFEFFLQI